ncbi:MAG: hypothetical protein HUK16_07425 [Bacteroidales bacterium]|nr:hypothetical protein [Bacteroidales bacterium]
MYVFNPNIIGRRAEQAELQRLYDSKVSEFVVVYGRRARIVQGEERFLGDARL